MQQKAIIIGGGAAGIFAAIACAEANPELEVIVLEKAKDLLQKVRISGGGRCNVTHACFVPRELVQFYPRGQKELLGPFNRFQPSDTMEWFADRGVDLKIESDNRVFPITNDSETIVSCLLMMAESAGVKIKSQTAVLDIKKEDETFTIKTTNGDFETERLLIAAGSSKKLWDIIKKLGHSVVEQAPSLFTFNIKDARIKGLAGISVENTEVSIANSELVEYGPLLITHWGISGPAVLKLSSWGAFDLADRMYYFPVLVNWTANFEPEEVMAACMVEREANPRKRIQNHAMFGIPLRLWKNLATASGISNTHNWADISNKVLNEFVGELTASCFQVSGKSTFKDEFVTAGGVDLKEINFKRFESKIHPNLFFAGEILNIDALTGGFNFQAAWTGGWLAGHALAGEELD
jgi:predicted Rossmann fold flavoprotein